MWGDKCSTIGDCDYYDPLEEDHSKTCATIQEETERQEWRNYLHYLRREEV